MAAISDNPFKFEYLIDDIKRSLNIWHKKICDCYGNIITFTDELGTVDRPGRLITECDITARRIKRHFLLLNRRERKFNVNTFIEDTGQTMINYHLAAAIYIRSFLKNPPFSIEIARNPILQNNNMIIRPVNEYYILNFFITMFLRGINHNNNGILTLSEDKQTMFINYLTQCKNNIQNFEPVSFSDKLVEMEQEHFRDPGFNY